MTKPQNNSYSAESMQVLEGLDAVRKRPGMYLQDVGTKGLNHAVQEIVDNAVDEALAGYCTNVELTLHADGSAEVSDDGRGIPVDVNSKTNLTGVELAFTKLHGGGKFGGSGYEVAGGLHGVGASVVNALSTRVEVQVKRNGFVHEITFSRGEAGLLQDDGSFVKQTGLRKTVSCPEDETGTVIRFWPDRSIFSSTAVYDAEYLKNRFRQTAFLVPGLNLSFRDERGEDVDTESFKFDGGMRDFVEFLATDRPVSDIFHIQGEGKFTESVSMLDEDSQKMVPVSIERTMKVEAAIRWGVGYETTVRSLVNIVETPKGGTHLTGFERALNKSVNEALRATKILRATDDSVIKEDVQEGLTAVVLVRVPEPQFEGQPKEVLGTPDAAKIVSDVVYEGLKNIFSDPKQKQQVRSVLEKINQAAKTRKAARQAKETIRRKNALESSALPAKLADCRSDDMELTELMIVEGDSAAGTAKGARNSEYQALMPIRGKILNTMRATEKQMLDNAECAAIITAMGSGSGKSFDLETLRYGKLILLVDADVDGAHIRCLLLTLCWRYMRPLLEAGRVYAAIPPLHRITEKGSKAKHYTYSEEEYLKVRDDILAAGRFIKETQRYKGLGEMDVEQLAETTIDRDHRRLRRVKIEDAEAAAKVFEVLMGTEVPARKDFIIENGGLLDPSRVDV